MPPTEDRERAGDLIALAELAEAFLALVAALSEGDWSRLAAPDRGDRRAVHAAQRLRGPGSSH